MYIRKELVSGVLDPSQGGIYGPGATVGFKTNRKKMNDLAEHR